MLFKTQKLQTKRVYVVVQFMLWQASSPSCLKQKKRWKGYVVMLSGKESSAPPRTQSISTSKIQIFDASIALAQLTDTWSCQRWWSTCCVMKWQQTFGTKEVLKDAEGILHCMSHQCILKDKNTNVMWEFGLPRFLDNALSSFAIFSKATFLGDNDNPAQTLLAALKQQRFAQPPSIFVTSWLTTGLGLIAKSNKKAQLWTTWPIICIAIFRKHFCIPAWLGSFSSGNRTLKGESPTNL